MAQLFIEVLLHYRRQGKYLLHEFVLMPDHFHVLITPAITLERALQLIKGGFSFRARKELGFGGEIWQTSFYDRRVRDIKEYRAFREYIHRNPVKRGLVGELGDYAYSSAGRGFVLDGLPQRLKQIGRASCRERDWSSDVCSSDLSELGRNWALAVKSGRRASMIGGSGISKNTVPFGSTFTVILSKEGWWESWGIMPIARPGGALYLTVSLSG